MIVLGRRRSRRGVARRAERPRSDAALLVRLRVRPDATPATVDATWARDVSAPGRAWLEAYALVAFLAKQAFDAGGAAGAEVVRLAAIPARRDARYDIEVWRRHAQAPFLRVTATQAGAGDAARAARLVVAHGGEHLRAATTLLRRLHEERCYEIDEPADMAGVPYTVMRALEGLGIVTAAFPSPDWIGSRPRP